MGEKEMRRRGEDRRKKKQEESHRKVESETHPTRGLKLYYAYCDDEDYGCDGHHDAP